MTALFLHHYPTSPFAEKVRLILGHGWQGQGLMAEACAEVTRYWFEELGRDCLRVPKASPNLASRRLSERSGMRLIRVDEDEFVGGRYARETWEITRREWRRLK
mgnify:CR=1 FL=1